MFDSNLGQPCDGPMGISVALSPATATVTVSKSMITNASFRTKKLPGNQTYNLMIHTFFYCINVLEIGGMENFLH